MDATVRDVIDPIASVSIMHTLYPEGPASVPQKLTEPSATYRRHAWLAMSGLLAFIAIYFGLLVWFVFTAYRLFKALAAGSNDPMMLLLGAGCATFLAIFMIKALIFNKRAHDKSDDIELKPQDQPELFAFLHRLADEAGAPRPHRVFLSSRVNACVFYDLSPMNLIFPSKKNLEIGLGLVNVLSLGELKAVLAHEFGHFAQRSMAVGRWVYIAQQIAGHIVAKRDALDSFLEGLSRIDIRIAWIGWLLSVIVWSIRSLVEMVFRGVVLAQRALSREMEYQADLVAASLTGSDALVHALHRLGAADDAWNRALQFANGEAQAGRAVKDVFALQLRIIERMRAVLADPEYGLPPRAADGDPGAHRVFSVALAQPPQMWSTHPSNEAREANVKRVYIPCDIDERSALSLLRDAQGLKEDATRRMISGEAPAFVPIEESLERLDHDFDLLSLSPRYRGTYLGRSVVRTRKHAHELYPTAPSTGDPLAQIDALYSSQDGENIESLRELEEQRAMLKAIVDGDLKASGGVVQWRGAQVPRKSLPGVLAELDAEIAPLREAVEEHDRRCRGAHLMAAERLGPAWAQRLRGQLEVLHYAEHAKADIVDAYRLLHNTYAIVTADRRVSSSELRRLVASCNQLYEALANVYGQASQVTIDDAIAQKLGAATWPTALNEKFSLSRASEENINAWMNVIDGWFHATVGPLSALRHAALESLLASEDEVARQTRSGECSPEPTTFSVVPREYIAQLPGQERRLQKTLGWWDRFQTADGWLPGAARVAVAGGIVGAVFAVGSSVGLSKVSIFNGLARPVVVSIDDTTTEVQPYATVTLDLPTAELHLIETKTADTGEVVESFEGEASEGAPHFVYNVASAVPLVQWTAVYGAVKPVPEERLGAVRWSETSVDHVFEEPPETISSKGEGGTRTVLSAVSDPLPMNVLSGLAESDTKSETAIAEAHARWDSAKDGYLPDWFGRAKSGGQLPQILAARLARAPEEIASLREQQDTTVGAEHEAVCAKHRAQAAKPGATPAMQYIALRCIDDAQARNVAFLDAHRRWPQEPWLKFAAGYAYAYRAQWTQAEPLLEAAAAIPEAAPMVMIDIARLKRAKGEGDAVTALAAKSSYLQTLLALETGKGTENTPVAAFAMLARGDIDGAMRLAASNPGLETQLLPLVAASDGADDETVRRALALPKTTTDNPAVLWALYALASRRGLDGSAWREAAMKAEPEQSPDIARFLDALREGADERTAEAALGEVGLHTRGAAYAAAAVYMGTRCPSRWRTLAKQLLFGPERPYFS